MMSTLAVTTPATSLALLTPAELREAAGVSDNSQDAKLAALGLRIAAAITAECGVAVGAGAAPTLRRETLTQTMRCVGAKQIELARRHEVSITSVVADLETLTTDDYVVDPESGLLTRLSSDLPINWCANKVTVVYAAGFDEVPPDLKMAAMDFVRLAWAESRRDPALRGEVVDIPDVRRVEKTWWVGSVPGSSHEGAVPDIVAGQLARFRNLVFA